MSDRKHEHILRTPLPWRGDDAALTECGLPADSRTTLTVEAMLQKIAREGQARAALSSCMTCWQTTNRRYWAAENSDELLQSVGREIERVQWQESPERSRLVRELRAMSMLVAAHREDFDKLVADLGEVISLPEARRKQAGR